MKLKKILSESGHNRYSKNTLKLHTVDVSISIETDTELFENFLCSYSSWLRAVKNINLRHTDYSLHSSKEERNDIVSHLARSFFSLILFILDVGNV